MFNMLHAYASGNPSSLPNSEENKQSQTFAQQIAEKNKEIRIEVQNIDTAPNEKTGKPEENSGS